MILYLDTSSLVKALFGRARVVATSQVAYAEACAAFVRKHRQGDFTDEQYHTVITNLQQYWVPTLLWMSPGQYRSLPAHLLGNTVLDGSTLSTLPQP